LQSRGPAVENLEAKHSLHGIFAKLSMTFREILGTVGRDLVTKSRLCGVLRLGEVFILLLG